MNSNILGTSDVHQFDADERDMRYTEFTLSYCNYK